MVNLRSQNGWVFLHMHVSEDLFGAGILVVIFLQTAKYFNIFRLKVAKHEVSSFC